MTLLTLVLLFAAGGLCGAAAPPLCRNCMYVKDDAYYRTDASGAVNLTFPCTGPVAKYFCALPATLTVDNVTPDPADVCSGYGYPVKCVDTRDVTGYVTMWGDSRSATDYALDVAPVLPVSGHGVARDWFPEDFVLLAYTTQTVPAVPFSVDRGVASYVYDTNRNVFAYRGATVWTTLLHHDAAPVVAFKTVGGAGAVPPTKYDWRSNPPYANNNSMLILYTGYDDYDKMKIALSGSSTTLRAANGALYTYLSSHGNVRTVSNPKLTNTRVIFSSTAPADAQHFTDMMALATGCDPSVANDCLTGIGLTVQAHVPSFTFAAAPNFYAKGYTVFSGVPPKPRFVAGEHTGGPRSVVHFITTFGPESDQLQYPFFMFTYAGTDRTSLDSRVCIVEESVDGTTWTAHPQATAPDYIPFYNSGDWAGLLTQSYITSACASGYCYMPVGVTGRNKYARLRALTAYSADTRASPSSTATTGDFKIIVPGTFLSAGTYGQVSLYVVPSLSPTRDLTDAGYDGCLKIPGCTFFGNTPGYPMYPRSAVSYAPDIGSFDMRTFMRDNVMPSVLGGCVSGFLPDPVTTFASNPSPTVSPALVNENNVEVVSAGGAVQHTQACYRYSQNPRAATCYIYSRSAYVGSDMRVATDALGIVTQYSRLGVSLTVYVTKALGSNPVPINVVGPFTPDSLAASLYVYASPVPGSLNLNGTNIWISQTLVCTNGPHAGFLARVPSCVCIPNVLMTPTTCLCANKVSYANVISPTPPGLSFVYPEFFSAFSFPTNLTLVSNQLAYNTDVFTAAAIDCVSFLCGTDKRCMGYLKQSAYTAFCANVKTTLTELLANLGKVNGEVFASVKKYMSKNAVGSPDALLKSVSADPAVLATNTSSFYANVKDYASAAMTAQIHSGNVPISDTSAAALVRQLPASTTAIVQTDAYVTGKVVQSIALNQLGSAVTDAGYVVRPPQTTWGQAFGMSLFPSIGVGILTEKVNALWTQLEGVETQLNVIGRQFNILTSQVTNALQVVSDIASKQAAAHNRLVADMNVFSQTQNHINQQFNAALNALAQQIDGVEAKVSYLDLISSRASTLVAQYAAIGIVAADQASRARTFKVRVDACTSPTTASAGLCSQSSGALVYASVKTQGTTTVLDTLVLTPTNSTSRYTSQEFCFQGRHYVADPGYAFVLVDGAVFVSSRAFYALENITLANSKILPTCSIPRYALVSFSPSVGAASIDLTFNATSVIERSKNAAVNIVSSLLPAIVLPMFTDAYANITAQLDALANLTGQIKTNVIAPYVGTTFVTAPGSGGAGFDLGGLLGIGGISIGTVALLAVGALVFVCLCKSRGI